MTGLRQLRRAEDPPALFLRAWEVAMKLGAGPLSMVQEPEDARAKAAALTLALRQDDGAEAARACSEIFEGWPTGNGHAARCRRAALLLLVMRAIDTAMAAVHPRSRLLPPAITPLPAPLWAREASERRTIAGHYAETQDHYLVPRGPFARSARGRFHEAGFSLPDQFAHLGCGIRGLHHDAGVAKVEIEVVGQGSARGVPPRRGSEGRERATFVPLAETAHDLVAVISVQGAISTIDVRQGDAFDPEPAFAKAVRDAAASDLLIAPELTSAPGDLGRFAEALAAGTGPRLVVTGSGLAPGENGGPPRNRAVVMNSLGAILWRHDKIWSYGMSADTCARLDLPGAPAGGCLMEHISTGETITIADVDGFGRCVILICQDLQLAPLGQLLRTWQPDWIIVPVLDHGTGLDRWSTHRAAELSGESQARFLIGSSLTMVHWLKKKPRSPLNKPVGVAIGPRVIAEGDAGMDEARQGAEVACESKTRRHGTIEWRGSGDWRSFDANYRKARRKKSGKGGAQ